MNLNTYFSYWAELYKEDMMNNIMPFWMKYGLDTQNGGIYTCVGRDGQLLDTTKSVWFQGRFAFTCCFAYNNIEPCQQWLDAAKSTLDFIEAHCFDTDGRMFFEVTAEGTPLRKRRYVFSESFAAIAMLNMHWQQVISLCTEGLVCFQGYAPFPEHTGNSGAKYLPAYRLRDIPSP